MTGQPGLGFAINRTITVLVTQRLRDSEIRSGQENPRVSEPFRVGGGPRSLFPPLDAQGDGGLDWKWQRSDDEPRWIADEGGVVGTTGFEPATSWSQTKCSTGLSYVPNRDERVALDFA